MNLFLIFAAFSLDVLAQNDTSSSESPQAQTPETSVNHTVEVVDDYANHARQWTSIFEHIFRKLAIIDLSMDKMQRSSSTPEFSTGFIKCKSFEILANSTTCVACSGRSVPSGDKTECIACGANKAAINGVFIDCGGFGVGFNDCVSCYPEGVKRSDGECQYCPYGRKAFSNGTCSDCLQGFSESAEGTCVKVVDSLAVLADTKEDVGEVGAATEVTNVSGTNATSRIAIVG